MKESRSTELSDHQFQKLQKLHKLLLQDEKRRDERRKLLTKYDWTPESELAIQNALESLGVCIDDETENNNNNNTTRANDDFSSSTALPSQLVSLSSTSTGTNTDDSSKNVSCVDSYWQRSLPMSLISHPQYYPSKTTIVPLSSLPHSQRSQYIHKLSFQEQDSNPSNSHLTYTNTTNDYENDDNNTLVEIPIHILNSSSMTATNTNGNTINYDNSLSHRPLAGNLSSKLVDYTRGVVGKRQPFRPGGMDDSNNIDYHYNDDEQQQPQHTEEDNNEKEQSKVAKLVLQKGSITSWKDGTLLTAPPGVSFQVGLRLQDVFEGLDSTIGEKGCDVAPPFLENEYIDCDVETHNNLDNNSQERVEDKNNLNWQSMTVSKMWDKTYFDEDSLFGGSTDDDDDESSQESASSEDENSSDNETNDDTEPSKVESSSQDKNKLYETNIPLTGVEDHETKETDNDDDDDIDGIDDFLSELTLSTSSNDVDKIILARKKNSLSITKKISTNPLHTILHKQSTNQNQERKSWAVTASLPIDDFYSLVPNPALTYPFELDTFQKQAVARLERGECIFVAAHTSAGKTVCAEYAIALARKHCTRAIYTSPIKALSNQKYRDFKDKFGNDVGLITGDLQINPDSSCLIMTTEILRSMLYRGADLVRDIEWVIFDEVHYINDTERGVVWEEVIIMLPDYVNMIFLSATTPNTVDFSDWIGRTKKKPVHVIRTSYRPVPLSHYLYAGLELHQVLEGKGGFMESGWKEAAQKLLPASERQKQQLGKKGVQPKGIPKKVVTGTGSKTTAWLQSGSKQDWISLIKFLDREGLMPTVVFSFSKKKCEEIANMLRTVDLSTAAERNTAHAFAIQAMGRLSPSDALLPQVILTCEMVKRGIGVHHGGMLPIMKEMVEILFSKNLIKVLFATETFAMGVNMPARSVVFNSIRKHDGTQFRELLPGEYTQMAGRAGRRGLDKVGTVIICCFGDEPPPMLALKNMLTGSSTKLQSQFRLTYNMILNLLRVEDMTVEGMIKRSFSEFATQRALTANDYPKLLKKGIKKLKSLDDKFANDSYKRIGAEDIETYYTITSELLHQSREALSLLLSSAGSTAGGSLVPGRIILVCAARKRNYVRAPAIIVKSPVVPTMNDTSGKNSTSKATICLVLLPSTYVPNASSNSSSGSENECKLNSVGFSMKRYYAVHEIENDEILFVSSIKHKIDFSKIYKEDSQSSALGSVVSPSLDFFAGAKFVSNRVDDFAGFTPRSGKASVEKSSSTESSDTIGRIVSILKDAEKMEMESNLAPLNLMDCLKGVNSGDIGIEIRSLYSSILNSISLMRSCSSHNIPTLETHYIDVAKREYLRSTIKTLRHLLSNESLQLFPDFLLRKDVLRTLNYIDENDTVCIKGRVACEVNTCEELIITEMIFEGLLNELMPSEIVAILSALIFQEKSNDEDIGVELPDRLKDACDQMKTIAKKLGQLQLNHGLQVDPNDYCDSCLKFGLVHVTYEWALGVPFSNICELTSVQEGSIVRCITRLDELCREVRNCARVVGNPTLYCKMEEASVLIKRDIVFASSLYVT